MSGHFIDRTFDRNRTFSLSIKNLWNVLSINFVFYKNVQSMIFLLWNVLSMIFLWNVLSIKCPISMILLSMKCPSIKCLSMKCPSAINLNGNKYPVWRTKKCWSLQYTKKYRGEGSKEERKKWKCGIHQTMAGKHAFINVSKVIDHDLDFVEDLDIFNNLYIFRDHDIFEVYWYFQWSWLCSWSLVYTMILIMDFDRLNSLDSVNSLDRDYSIHCDHNFYIVFMIKLIFLIIFIMILIFIWSWS